MTDVELYKNCGNLQHSDLALWDGGSKPKIQIMCDWAQKTKPAQVGKTCAAGEGWWQAGIFQPAPAPVATRPTKPVGFADL